MAHPWGFAIYCKNNCCMKTRILLFSFLGSLLLALALLPS